MYVYCYHIPQLNSIKIGKGDPASRMADYTRTYNLTADRSSLHFWAMPTDASASAMESRIHANISLMNQPFTNREGATAREIFTLGSTDYRDAVAEVKAIIGRSHECSVKRDREMAAVYGSYETYDKAVAENDRYAAELRADAAIRKFKMQHGDLTLDVDITPETEKPETEKPTTAISWIGFAVYCVTAAPALAAVGILLMVLLISALGIAANGYTVLVLLISPFFFFGYAVHWGYENIVKTP